MTTTQPTTREPVTVSGSYEMTDGTFHRFAWRDGRLHDDGPVPAALSAEERAALDEQMADYEATRA